MLNKKGFTLIELLAIIILLAIILVITMPKIAETLSNSRKSAAEDTIKSIEKAVLLYSASMDLDTGGTLPVTITFENGKYYYQYTGENKVEGNLLEIKGKAPENGKVVIYPDKSYEYALYNSSTQSCVKKDSTNYLTVTNTSMKNDGYIIVTNFKGETNRTISIGTLSVSNIKATDTIILDYDVEYTDAVYDFNQSNPGFVFQGSGNSTGWNPGVAFDKIKLSGTGVYHASSSRKLTTTQKGNTTFSMNFRFDHYTAGTIKISNVKVVKQNAQTETSGKCF